MKTQLLNKNVLIIVLLGIVMLMGIGFAAFSQRLTITETSGFDSNWNVYISNAEFMTNAKCGIKSRASFASCQPSSIDVTGSATVESRDTASLRTELKYPGDRGVYRITVKNDGNVDAILEKVNITASNENSVISYSISNTTNGAGIEYAELLAGEEYQFYVYVDYDYKATGTLTEEQKTNSATIDLDFVQKENEDGSVSITPTTNIGGKNVALRTSGSGLYADSYEAGRYIYRGSDVNNYVEFADGLWRIISKEADGTYKIIKDELLSENKAFDEANARTTAKNTYCTNPADGCGVFAAVTGNFSTPSGTYSGTVTEDSTIKKYLNGDYLTNLSSTYKQFIQEHSFNIGSVEYLDQSGNDTMENNIVGEKMYTWTGNVGLINVTDVLRASTNPLCTSATENLDQANNGVSVCNDSYLFTQSNVAWWTINAFATESVGYPYAAWGVGDTSGRGGVGNDDARYEYGVRPALYLKSNITFLDGTGTHDDPYKIDGTQK